jgi:Ig-like domain-containing protein
MRLRAFAALGLSVSFAFSLAGCGGGANLLGSATTAGTPPAIMAHPESKTVLVGEIATFSATATGTPPLSYQWQKNGTAISGATASSCTTPPATLADNGAKFQVVVSNSLGTATSNPATLTVSSEVASVDVVSYHNDAARTGQNLNETLLTIANVNSANFGKRRTLPVDGKVDAQPLYLSNLKNIAGGTHNVVYVATDTGASMRSTPIRVRSFGR